MKFYGATRGKYIPQRYARLTAEVLLRLGGTGISRQDNLPADAECLVQWGGAATEALLDAYERKVPFMILNAGYFDDTRFNRFSVTINGFHGIGMHQDCTAMPDRRCPTVKPWKRGTDGKVLILGQKAPVYEVHGLSAETWLTKTAQEAAERLFRPSLIRRHPSIRGPRQASLPVALEDASAVVTLSSNASVAAALSGVPVVALHRTCPAWDVAMHSYTDDPYPTGREEWVQSLAQRDFSMFEQKDLDAAAVYIARAAPFARTHAESGKSYVRGVTPE